MPVKCPWIQTSAGPRPLTSDEIGRNARQNPAGLDSNPTRASTRGPGGRPCQVTVRLKNGQTYSRDAEHAKGGPEFPMTEAELKTKFMECACQAISASAAERTLESVQRLDTLQDIRPLCQLVQG